MEFSSFDGEEDGEHNGVCFEGNTFFFWTKQFYTDYPISHSETLWILSELLQTLEITVFKIPFSANSIVSVFH